MRGTLTTAITTLPGAKAVIDFPEHGLFLSLGKTTIAGHKLTREYIQACGLTSQLLQVVTCAGGSQAATVLGSPVGSQQFIHAQMAPTLGKISRYCNALLHLLDPQFALTLLRQSLAICRVTHSLIG